MELPIKAQKGELEGMPKDLSLLLFGPPKIGKTTFGASFPNCLVVECEPKGARYISGRVINVENLNELREVWKLLDANPDYCETIVIDTLDRIAQWVENEICKEMNLKNILESKKGEKHGAQWGEYSHRILTQLEGWKMLGKRIIFLAHTKKAELDGDGLVINPKTINLYGQVASRVLSIVENVGHFYARKAEGKKIERVLSFAPGITVDAGARHPLLADKIIVIERENPFKAFGDLFEIKKPATNGMQKTLPKSQKKKKETIAS